MENNRTWILKLMTLVMILSCIFGGNVFKKSVFAEDKDIVSPVPYGDITINVFVAAIDPYLSSVDGKNFGNGSNRIRASEYNGFSLSRSVDFLEKNIEESSHNTVDINIVGTTVLDEFPKYTNIASLDNESYQKLFVKKSSGYGDWYNGVRSDAYKPYDNFGKLDYNYYINELDLVNRKNAGEFDMVFLIGIDPLQPAETCMVGKKSFFINGDSIKADCDNFVIVSPTFSRRDGSFENIGHMAEDMLGYNYGVINYSRGCIDGSDYSKLNDWQKFCLCEYLATSNTEVYGYGMVHFSPNSKKDYDWYNNTPVNYYSDWKNGTGLTSFTADSTYLKDSFYNYQNIYDSTAHHRWWFYNMPYAEGRDKDGYYNSWWRYIFTPDFVSKVEPEGSGIIDLEVGQSAELGFNIIYYSGKSFESDIESVSAAVVNSDSSVAAVENGSVTAKKLGSTTIEVKIDGKKATFTVNVVEHLFEATSSADTHTCTLCGKNEGHAYTSVCKEKCSVCGKENANPSHTAVIDKAVEATCLAYGKTEGSHCLNCGKILVTQHVVAKRSHNIVIDSAIAPTCTKPGYTAGKHCLTCDGYTVVQTVIPATGHTVVVDAAIPATTTSIGLTEGSHCMVCGTIIKSQTIIAKLPSNTPSTPSTPSTPAKPLKYRDVLDGKYYTEHIYYLRDKGTMTGFSDTVFGFGKKLLREDMVTLLWKNEGKPYIVAWNYFRDLKSSKYYYTPVLWAKLHNIVNGYSVSRFGVGDNITRQDFIKIIYGYASYKGYSTKVKSANSYLAKTDAGKVSKYAREAINWGYENGLIGNGSPLNPKSNITRQDAAVIISRFLKKFDK